MNDLMTYITLDANLEFKSCNKANYIYFKYNFKYTHIQIYLIYYN